LLSIAGFAIRKQNSSFWLITHDLCVCRVFRAPKYQALVVLSAESVPSCENEKQVPGRFLNDPYGTRSGKYVVSIRKLAALAAAVITGTVILLAGVVVAKLIDEVSVGIGGMAVLVASVPLAYFASRAVYHRINGPPRNDIR
jgi:hypothetical protein